MAVLLFAALVASKLGDPASAATPLTTVQVNGFLQGIWEAIGLGHDFSDFQSCITDQDTAGVQLQAAMTNLNSSSAVDVSYGLTKLSKAVSIMLEALNACNMKDQYYVTLKEIIGNFTRPSSLTVLQGTTLTIDGIEVSSQVAAAVTACSNLAMSSCGDSIGNAMGMVYYGQFNVTTDATVAQINALPNVMWTAASSAQFKQVNLWEFKKSQLGLKYPPKNQSSSSSTAGSDGPTTVAAPTTSSSSTPPRTTTSAPAPAASFDSRTKWPKCIHPIRNQGQCGDCWAVAASEVLSDRYCIATNASTTAVLAPQYLVSCDTTNSACDGGYVEYAWKFLESSGEVTESCFPYQSSNGLVPTCSSFKKCLDGTTPMRKYYTKVNSTTEFTTPLTIQNEITANGPVEAAMDVYNDFMSYSSGIYHMVTGAYLGGHAVKIIGWGVTAGVNYWIVANSWGTTWGEAGFFQIQFGNCNIDSFVYSGIPDLSRTT